MSEVSENFDLLSLIEVTFDRIEAWGIFVFCGTSRAYSNYTGKLYAQYRLVGIM